MTGESTTEVKPIQDPQDGLRPDPGPPPVQVTEVTDPNERSEIDRIDPDHAAGDWNVITLSDGTKVRVRDLKTIEFFALLRIVTRGSTPIMNTLNLDPAQGTEGFTAQLIALLAFSVPEADQETIEFVRLMVTPTEVPLSDEDRNSARAMKAANRTAQDHLDELLSNPELDDSFAIIEAVVRREAPDLMALGKRLVALIPRAMENEQENQARKRNRQASSGDSPGPST